MACNLSNIFHNLYFKRLSYKHFLNMIDKSSGQVAYMSIVMTNDMIQIYFNFKREVIIFEKNKNSDLVKRNFFYSDELSKTVQESNLKNEELKNLILNVAEKATTFSGEEIQPFLYKYLNEAVHYFGISRKMLSDIYKDIYFFEELFVNSVKPTITGEGKWKD